MRRIGLLILVLIVAIGSLGVGYAMWSDTITISGTASTGMVVLCVEDKQPPPGKPPAPSYLELNSCPIIGGIQGDENWLGWIEAAGNESCPPGYAFEYTYCVNKDVAWVEFIPVYDETPVHHIKELKVIIHNAYPYYLAHISFELCNCGNIPIHVGPEIINQDPSLVIEYRNGAGQLEPGNCHEISFWVGVTQYKGHWVDGIWIVDTPDPNLADPLTPQGVDLEFTITLTGYQWNEWPLTP